MTESYKMASFHCVIASEGRCIIEGSAKGKLWLRESEAPSSRFLKLITDFSDKIKHIGVDTESRLMTISAKDGRVKVYKLPVNFSAEYTISEKAIEHLQ